MPRNRLEHCGVDDLVCETRIAIEVERKRIAFLAADRSGCHCLELIGSALARFRVQLSSVNKIAAAVKLVVPGWVIRSRPTDIHFLPVGILIDELRESFWERFH